MSLNTPEDGTSLVLLAFAHV